jgi:hypothetical protein
MGENGDELRPILPQAPRRFAWNGYYGLQPHGWVTGGSLLVAGVRTEWGDELALVDTQTTGIRTASAARTGIAEKPSGAVGTIGLQLRARTRDGLSAQATTRSLGLCALGRV